MILHYINDGLISGLSANKNARINMAKAFSRSVSIETLFLYFIRGSRRMEDEGFIGNNVIKRPIIINGYNDEIVSNYTGWRLITNYLQKIYIIIIFIIIFLKHRRSEFMFIRGQKCLFSLFVSNMVRKNNYALELHNFDFGSSKLVNYIYKSVMNNAKYLVTISEYTKDIWIRNDIKKESIYVLPSGVDYQSFIEIKNTKEQLRNLIHLPMNKKIVTYIGSLGVNRGIEDIIKTAHNLPGILFIIIGGNTDQIEDYNNFIISNYLKKLDNLRFIGHIASNLTISYMKASDILLAPYSSRISTVHHMSPIKLFEYMASGTAMIVSDLPRIRDILSDEEAVFFKPDDSEDLAKKISYLLLDEGKRHSIAKNAFQKSYKYSWDKRAEFIIEKALQ